MTAPFEAQLEALGADLLALDEKEARTALRDVQDQIASLTRHAERLRVALELRAAWIAATTEKPESASGIPAQPSPPVNGRKKPKTKDVLIAAFKAEPAREFTTKELREILADHRIEITPEGARLALRRLDADDVIFRPRDGHYQLRNPLFERAAQLSVERVTGPTD